MSKILIIDTATEACSVALEVNGELFEDYQVAPRQHGELLLPMVDAVLRLANVKLEDLDCIGYGQGPGAFTGLRICVSIVQGLAFGADVPVVGCSSLQAMAQKAYLEENQSQVLSAIDARMGEVYWGQYQLDNDLMTLVGEEIVTDPENVTFDATHTSSFYGTGSGWDTYHEVLSQRVSKVSTEAKISFPRASAMLPWVKAELTRGHAVAAEYAQPVYLRNDVAKKKAEQGKS